MWLALPFAIVAAHLPQLAAAQDSQESPASVPAEPGQMTDQSAVTPPIPRQAILLFRSPGDDMVVGHLRADLTGAGWELVEVQDGDAPERLAQAARDEHARAALRVDRLDGRIELWVLRARGALRETIVVKEHELSDWVLATRALEALRAHGLALLEPVPAPAAGEPPAAELPSAPKLSEPPPLQPQGQAPEAYGSLGAGLSASPGGLPPQAHAFATLGLETASGFGGALLGFLPVISRQLQEPEGRIDARSWLFGLAGYKTLELGGGAHASAGLGYLLAVHTFAATPGPGYRGVQQTLVAGAPVLPVQLGWSLADQWQFVAFGTLGVSVPETKLRVAGRPVASWGRPWGAFAVALRGAWLPL